MLSPIPRTVLDSGDTLPLTSLSELLEFSSSETGSSSDSVTFSSSLIPLTGLSILQRMVANSSLIKGKVLEFVDE